MKAAEAIKANGAENIYVCATHGTLLKAKRFSQHSGVFSRNAIQIINDGPFKKVVITNSIHHADIDRKSEKIVVLSVSNLIGEAIRRTHNEESVSSLFDMGTTRNK